MAFSKCRKKTLKKR